MLVLVGYRKCYIYGGEHRKNKSLKKGHKKSKSYEYRRDYEMCEVGKNS